ncbi:MAG TPA: hypothetical protein VH414_04320 [Lichenihabitans sp.]|jgi:hypothetical protein|nr:hypothetical protein [Lichenihabitans sp.]
MSPSRPSIASHRRAGFTLVVLVLLGGSAAAATTPYPFEGTWVRADRICSPAAPSLRTYTAREIISPAGRCMLRKAVFGSGEWELFEDCRRSERSGNVIEKIRMMGADQMIVKRQLNRLKIPRGRRYSRCMTPAPKLAAPPIRPATPTSGVKPTPAPSTRPTHAPDADDDRSIH